jgi:hypothetical protein
VTARDDRSMGSGVTAATQEFGDGRGKDDLRFFFETHQAVTTSLYIKNPTLLAYFFNYNIFFAY